MKNIIDALPLAFKKCPRYCLVISVFAFDAIRTSLQPEVAFSHVGRIWYTLLISSEFLGEIYAGEARMELGVCGPNAVPVRKVC